MKLKVYTISDCPKKKGFVKMKVYLYAKDREEYNHFIENTDKNFEFEGKIQLKREE